MTTGAEFWEKVYVAALQAGDDHPCSTADMALQHRANMRWFEKDGAPAPTPLAVNGRLQVPAAPSTDDSPFSLILGRGPSPTVCGGCGNPYRWWHGRGWRCACPQPWTKPPSPINIASGRPEAGAGWVWLNPKTLAIDVHARTGTVRDASHLALRGARWDWTIVEGHEVVDLGVAPDSTKACDAVLLAMAKRVSDWAPERSCPSDCPVCHVCAVLAGVAK